MNWLPGIFRRSKVYGDLAEEMRLHLEERTEQLMGEGMSRKEAEQAARRAFGNATVLQERSREVWHLPLVESIGTDLKLVFRRLGKAPGFAATVASALSDMTPVLPEVKVSALGTDVVVDGCLAEGASLAWNQLTSAQGR